MKKTGNDSLSAKALDEKNAETHYDTSSYLQFALCIAIVVCVLLLFNFMANGSH